VGLPVPVSDNVQPLYCVQYPDEAMSWLQGAGVPIHLWLAVSQEQPLCPLQAPLPPVANWWVLHAVAVPEQTLAARVQPRVGMIELTTAQSADDGVPAQ
jgi:hypothetical protein